VSGVAPTTGITLSDEDVGENARSAAAMRACPCPAETLSHRAELVDLRTADLGDMARPFRCHADECASVR